MTTTIEKFRELLRAVDQAALTADFGAYQRAIPTHRSPDGKGQKRTATPATMG